TTLSSRRTRVRTECLSCSQFTSSRSASYMRDRFTCPSVHTPQAGSGSSAQGLVQISGLKYQELDSFSCRDENTMPGSALSQALLMISSHTCRAGRVSYSTLGRPRRSHLSKSPSQISSYCGWVVSGNQKVQSRSSFIACMNSSVMRRLMLAFSTLPGTFLQSTKRFQSG